MRMLNDSANYMNGYSIALPCYPHHVNFKRLYKTFLIKSTNKKNLLNFCYLQKLFKFLKFLFTNIISLAVNFLFVIAILFFHIASKPYPQKNDFSMMNNERRFLIFTDVKNICLCCRWVTVTKPVLAHACLLSVVSHNGCFPYVT